MTCKLGSKGPRETSGTEWDVPVTPDLQKSARVVHREIVKTPDVVFNRSKAPAGAQGKPKLVCSGDGGKSGSAGCISSKWPSQGGRPCQQTDGGQDLWPATLPRKEPISSKASQVEKDFSVVICEEERSSDYAAHVTGGTQLRSLSDLATTVSDSMTYSDEPRKVVSSLA